MRQSYPKERLRILCALFGYSRQAYYEAALNFSNTSIANAIVLTMVKELRHKIPILGTRKLLFMLSDEFHRHSIKNEPSRGLFI